MARRAAARLATLNKDYSSAFPKITVEATMSIKSDRWIRRMAAEHGMIEPFSPEQVRVARRPQDRLLRHLELRLRRALRGRIQDLHQHQFHHRRPEELRREIVRRFQGAGVHHSAELLRACEHGGVSSGFRASVLTVCLGKCVTGDTRLVDADTGAYVPITEMRWGKRTLAWDGWRLKPAKVSAFIPQGKREIFELRTRTGLRIRATANHPFRMLNRWVPLSDLRAGDRIAVAREIPVFGKTPIPEWEATLLGLMISEGQCNTPGHSPTYTTADPAMVALLESAMAASGLGEITYKGRYGYRLVNRKGRGGSRSEIVPMTGCGISGSMSARPTSSCRRSSSRRPSRRFACSCRRYSAATAAFITPRGVFPRVLLEVSAADRGCAPSLLRFGIFSLIREKTTAIGTRACKIQITDKDQILRFAGESWLFARLGEAAIARGEGASDDRRATAAQEQLRHAAREPGPSRHRGTGWRTELEALDIRTRRINPCRCPRGTGCPHDRRPVSQSARRWTGMG